jgi:molybdate transport system regulatory protein
MKTSARNQFNGTVSEVVMAQVHVHLKGWATLVASVTKDSVDALGPKNGVAVIALVKAPQIILVTNFGGYKFPLATKNNAP